jgi:methylmalonyl-CoA/ethylmalonyl-CoA epimerase
MGDVVRKVDHVAVSVPDLAEGARLFQDTLGGRFVTGGDNDDTGIRLVHFAFAGFKVELLQPLRDDSLLARTIRRKGTGFHHLTFVVDDVPATETVLERGGYPTTGTDVGNPKWCETFVRPTASFGALLQFASSTLDQDWSAEEFGLADVLAGRVVWHDTVACLRETVAERAGWRN